MGPSGIAKIASKIRIDEFRLFCFNITRTPDDYCRMSNESLRSPEIWCRVSMNCNYIHFAPLESICQRFSNDNQEFVKLVQEYKETLKDKQFKTICAKTKPNEGYQTVSEPKELFSICILNIASVLHERIVKKKLCLDDMKSYFCTLKISSIDHEQELLITSTSIQDNINKAKDVFFLLFAISPCWDCINFLFLEEHVVKQFGGEDEKRELESYKRHLKNRWLVRSVQEYPDMTAELTCFKYCHQIKCRINAEWDTTKINQVLKLKKVIASVYNVDLSVIKLLKTSKGSVNVYFALPPVCNKTLPDEHILLLAKHDFLELAVFDQDSLDKDKVSIVNYDITERFTALDNSFQASSMQSDDNELRSEVLLFEKVTKYTNPSLQHNSPARKVFKNWAKHYIVLQTFTTSSRLDIYHNTSHYAHGKNPIDSRTLYGINIQMKSDKRKPYILVITNQNSSLSISFNKQTEAQQWFIALSHIIGCFHLHLKVHPPHQHIPQDLVVKINGSSMIFWSVLDQHKCIDWQLCDIIAVSLNKALYVRVKSASNITLKEDLYVFEGQQLEILFDLLEDQLSSVVADKKKSFPVTLEENESKPRYLSHHEDIYGAKRIWSSETLSSEESGSTDNFCANDYQKYDMLNEIFSAEPSNTTYSALSWKVKDEICLQDKVIQLVKASWFGVISKYILNRGYRIIVTMPDQQIRVLAQEKNNPEGKRRIQDRWKIVQALQEDHIALNYPSSIKEIGHFQMHMMVVEASEIPVHDSSLCHFQNVYYGSTVKVLEALHPSIVPDENSFYTGIAQCTIPLVQLAEMCGTLSSKRFWLKLWPNSSAPQTGITINYQSEIEKHKFKDILNGSLFPSQHASVFTESELLLYIPCSLQSFDETVIQASQLVVNLGFSGKIAIFEWHMQNHTDYIGHAMKPLLQFLKMLCSHSTKVHIVAVDNGALLLVKSLTDFGYRLGQIILTKLHGLSQPIFAALEEMEQKSNSLLSLAENITIYHKPKPLYKSQSLTQSYRLGRNPKNLFKKFSVEPPPFIPRVDIICLESNLDCYLKKRRECATSEMIIEDMSEIIYFGKCIVDRSSRVRLQCSCNELRRPIYRSNLPCMICSCCSNFVIGYVEGLGNLTPTVLESLHEGHNKDKMKKCSSIRKGMQLEETLSYQYKNKTSTLITKSAPE